MDFLPVQLLKRRADGSSYLHSHLLLPHLQKGGMKWSNVTVGGDSAAAAAAASEQSKRWPQLFPGQCQL